ncbi:IS110 family transposase [Streptomyces atratus]|uniref:IS110 family transposase n=1 Tax=Streptomyces atratus TaxID=1893 RepID=UPI00357129F7
MHHASRSYRGNGKTDAKDAYVIADQARMRRDLQYSQGLGRDRGGSEVPHCPPLRPRSRPYSCHQSIAGPAAGVLPPWSGRSTTPPPRTL